jgi:hypothetical protein
MDPDRAVHNSETISINTATIEQCKALKVACDARIEILKRDATSQLRANLKALANAEGVTLPELMRRVLEGEEARGRGHSYASRRPMGMAAAERKEAMRKMKYFDPVSEIGWPGVGRAPAVFRDPETGTTDYRKLDKCLNPNWDGYEGMREDESNAAE